MKRNRLIRGGIFLFLGLLALGVWLPLAMIVGGSFMGASELAGKLGGFQGGFQSGGANFDFSSIFGDDIFSQFGGGARGFGASARRPRKGDDLAYTMRLDFLSAALGTEKAVMLQGKSINVKIPAGTTDGQTLRLKGLGMASPNGGPNGDVLITLNVSKHPYFEADGLNVLLEVPISIKEAVLGGKITVPTISGKVAVTIPPYSSSGEKLRLKGKGIKGRNGQGDEIVTLRIVVPQTPNPALEKAYDVQYDGVPLLCQFGADVAGQPRHFQPDPLSADRHDVLCHR